MKRLIVNLVILGTAAVAVLLFQNCSNVQFSAASSETVSKIGSVGDAGTGAGTDAEIPATDEDLRKSCRDLQANQSGLVALADGAKILDLYGNSYLKASGNILTIARVYGNFNILGTVAGANIGTIDASYGNIIICGMNVGAIINGTHGNLTVVGGNVGDVSHFGGNLRIVDGKITGTVESSNGNIAAK